MNVVAKPLLIVGFLVGAALIPTSGALLANVSKAPAVTDRILPPAGHDLAAIDATMRLPRATWYQDKDGNKLFDALDVRYAAAPPTAALHVIVTLRHGSDVSATLERAREVAGPFPVGTVFSILEAFSADLTLLQAQRIASLDAVRQIEFDEPVHALLDTAKANLGVEAVWQHLNINGDLDGIPGDWTANDTTISVVDTGFDSKHVDLKGKFLAFLDLEDNKEKVAYDLQGHGTHVASIAGGSGVGDSKLKGVAVGSPFVGVKIVDGGSGGSTLERMVKAYEWTLQNKEKYNVRVLTMSFGGGGVTDGTTVAELALDKLWKGGIVNFISAGNSGPRDSTVLIPSSARGAISVASMLDPAADPAAVTDWGFRLSTYSSRGPTSDNRIKPDIAAPGQSIMAAKFNTTKDYWPLSGTSMASPFAAGVGALVLSADPTLTPDQVRQLLFDTAEDWGLPGVDIDYGHGRIDALRAVQVARLGALVRQGAPYSELVKVASVPPPKLPTHLSGVLEEGEPTITFQVADAATPFVLTLLHNTTKPSPDGIKNVGLNVYTLRSADGTEANPAIWHPLDARQRLITFIPTQPGDYSIQFRNILPGSRFSYDLSAGVPAVAPPAALTLPDPATYKEAPVLASAAAPGVPLGWIVLAVAGAAFALMRRRG